jgi:hypothetical protein
MEASRVTVHGSTGCGVHPTIVRAHARAFALSVIPGNRRRNSIAADSSPSMIEGGPDRGGIGLDDDEHPQSMAAHTTTGKRGVLSDYMGERTLSYIWRRWTIDPFAAKCLECFAPGHFRFVPIKGGSAATQEPTMISLHITSFDLAVSRDVWLVLIAGAGAVLISFNK